LRQKIIDAAIVREVIADLDISQYLSQPEMSLRAPVPAISVPVVHAEDQVVGPPAEANGKHENLTLAEAKAYMETVARSLRN
jgi:hypothetical protein